MLISDAELAAEALAADPDTVVDPDAVPLAASMRGADLLPDWYMPGPAPGARRLRGARRRVAYVVVGSFLAINAAGLCSTYGQVVVA